MRIFLLTLFISALSISAAFADNITKEEIMAAQEKWAEGIVAISKAFMDGEDYKAAAEKHIKELYAYGKTDVLFKPTLASADQFRETYEEALSYFVGGIIEEDKGFAIKPWSAARFDGEQHIATYHDYAVSMGNYFFKPADGGAEKKVEFTFGYIKDEDGNILINVHHSSLPFQPK